MPANVLLQRRYWARVKNAQKLMRTGVKRAWGLQMRPFFIDYWIDMPATIPEKMVFAAS